MGKQRKKLLCIIYSFKWYVLGCPPWEILPFSACFSAPQRGEREGGRSPLSPLSLLFGGRKGRKETERENAKMRMTKAGKNKPRKIGKREKTLSLINQWLNWNTLVQPNLPNLVSELNGLFKCFALSGN